MSELIRKRDALAKCEAIGAEAKSYQMPQMAMGGYACMEAIAALPAVTVDPAAIREAALREAADHMAVISLHNPPRTSEIIKAAGRSILSLIPKGAAE